MSIFGEPVYRDNEFLLQQRTEEIRRLGMVAAAAFGRAGINKDFVINKMITVTKKSGGLFKKTTTTETRREFVDSYWKLAETHETSQYSNAMYSYYLLQNNGELGVAQSATPARHIGNYDELMYGAYTPFDGLLPLEHHANIGTLGIITKNIGAICLRNNIRL